VKVLVTGREGQLARSLVETAGAGVQVVAIGRPELDLADANSVAVAVARERPHIVVNAAAYTRVDKAETEPAVAHAVNALGAEHVASACAANAIPIIHISTDYVFEGTKDRPYVEDDPPAPVNVYGRTKLEGERRVAKACERHLILRSAWLHSPWGVNFVKTMLRLAATRPNISVVDDQFGSPTYAPDLAKIVLAAAARVAADPAGAHWGIYHAAGSGETNWYGFAREVFRRAAEQGLPIADVTAIPASEFPSQARRPANSRLNCDRLRLLVGVELPDWRAGVKDCVARLAKAGQAKGL
jgi:dTDP-4-dehydrorhamnose reductase